ncbi:hypothetical protein CIB48_g82 [Xylaria polymorpha]|nr:hypothetical protein CIB48_g82 [Xylaria polymorpha]
MFLKTALALTTAFAGTATADSRGYVLPFTGVASTTQFIAGSEFGGGTFCGVNALPNGQRSSGRQGGGPGYLYVNDYGQTWHFDIAVDIMSTDQYNKFFNVVTDGSNWRETYFEQTDCDGDVNPTPPFQSWGCMSGCSNNDAAGVCDNTEVSKF